MQLFDEIAKARTVYLEKEEGNLAKLREVAAQVPNLRVGVDDSLEKRVGELLSSVAVNHRVTDVDYLYEELGFSGVDRGPYVYASPYVVVAGKKVRSEPYKFCVAEDAGGFKPQPEWQLPLQSAGIPDAIVTKIRLHLASDSAEDT